VILRADTREFQRFAEEVPGRVRKALSRAMKSEGYRLKEEVATAIRTGTMGWSPIHPFTRALRKSRKGGPPGVWFSRFIRYGVNPVGSSFDLRVGVFNPPGGVKALSRTVLLAAERFASGWTEVVTLRAQRKRVTRYLAAKRKDWRTMSRQQKRAWRRKMLREGALVRVGTVLRSPPRPMDPFLHAQRYRIVRNIDWLFSQAVEGKKYSRNWWKERR